MAAAKACDKEAYDLILGDAGKVFDLEQESGELRERYGRSTFGQSCLLARRLIESGVRFVQLYSGDTVGWDAHDNVLKNHTTYCGRTDLPIAGLLQDLKQRGLLDDTLVVFADDVEARAFVLRIPYELDTVGRNDFFGTLPGAFTAHPKIDPDTGEMHAMVYAWGEWLDHAVADVPLRGRLGRR